MHKQITVVDGKHVVIESNGTTATTTAVYARELKDYTPLENGFNLELAQDILETIKANRELWDQGSWRRFFTAKLSKDERIYLSKGGQTKDGQKSRELYDAALAAVSYERDANDPVCGTAMCFAGWASELTGGAHVIDLDIYTKLPLTRLQWGYGVAEQVLVRREAWQAWVNQGTAFYPDLNEWAFLSDEIIGLLAKRGFSEDTHAIITVERYALMQLGLSHGDWLALFAGGNTIEMIDRIVGAYAAHGPECSKRVHMRVHEDIAMMADDDEYDRLFTPCDGCS